MIICDTEQCKLSIFFVRGFDKNICAAVLPNIVDKFVSFRF